MATILVVDDRHICREYLLTLLKHENHRLLEASDGADALNIITNEQPDLIITDLLMPTMNGYELVKKVKANPTLATIPIIFYTASFLLNEAKLLAETCDVNYILYKPSEPQVILNTVHEALKSNETCLLDSLLKEPTDAHKPGHQIKPLTDYLNELQQTNGTFNQLCVLSSRLLAMSELSIKMIAERDPEKFFKLVCKGARKVINSKYCIIGILDCDDSTKLKYLFMAEKGNVHEIKMDSILLQLTAIQKLLHSDDPLILTSGDDKQTNEFPAYHPAITNLLGTKLITSTQLYGFIYCVDKIDETQFTTSDISITNTLATEIAILYENIELHRLMQHYAVNLQIEAGKKEEENV